LRRRGVQLASITHAAGLSSTGDAALDAALPLPERFDIPEATVRAISAARGRVVAVGTTVVRALEGAAAGGGGVPPPPGGARRAQHTDVKLRAGRGETELVLGPGYRPRAADGLST